MNIPGSTVKDKVKLIKIESTHNLLRQDESIGWCYEFPRIGMNFMFWEEPKHENLVIREIITTPVQEFEWIYDRICEFKTRNSTYHLELV